MKIIDDLDSTQIRVLGALLEKEQATPDYYPLTVNALIAACNQKSNRDPVMQLTETEIVEALDSLAADTLVWRTDGARVERWRQSISRRLELDPEEKAVLTLLMLRGAQTVGELRSRSSRLHQFESLAEIGAALERMRAEGRELVVELSRAPGQKENRWAEVLSGPVKESLPGAVGAPRVTVPRVGTPARERSSEIDERLNALEARVRELAAELERLREGRESQS